MDRTRKTDLRVIKSKKAIRLEFAKLMHQKPIEEITVSEIAAGAMINRKTFYAHYEDIYAIISEIEDEIVASMQQLLSRKRFREILENPENLFMDVMRIINSDIDVYGQLLTSGRNASLITKLIRMIREQVCTVYAEESTVSLQTLDTAVHFMLSGLLAVFSEWYNSGRNRSIEALSEELSVLCTDGLHGMMKTVEPE